MSLQFIIGNSGSGKTEYMYRRIVAEAELNPTKNYLVIVPEQFTLQTQRSLVDYSSNKAIMNVDVLSFKRLAYRVFDDMGIRTLQVLEETGKNLVLRKVAQERAQELTLLRPNMGRMGYIGEVKSLLSELMQYNVSCEQLREHIEERDLPPVLAQKLRDVAVMYEGFLDFLEDNYITEEEILEVLEGVAEESALLRDGVIAFDEFTGFTPLQNRLLADFMRISDRIYITLTMDAREDFYHSRGSIDLFDLPKQTIRILLSLAQQEHTEVLDPVVLSDAGKKRFAKAPSLAFMEQNLFRPAYQRKMDEVQEICIASLKNPRDELVYAAREISRLVREKGYRYREIAVVTGAVENYSGYVEDVFDKYGIPFFLDRTKEVLFHPFIEFIRAGIEVVRRDFSHESVFRFLRCGFCGIDEREIDVLDNYILAAGIRGRRMWGRRFLRAVKDGSMAELEELEQLRQKIMAILEPLVKVFTAKDATAGMEIEALYEMITALGVEEQLHGREKLLLEQGKQSKSMEYGQIYRIVMQLLDKYVTILGGECMDIEEFAEVLDAGLDAAQVAVVPPGYDSVTVGDIERTRLNHIRILFFAGVNDGIVPKSGDRGGIISQYEREILKESELALAPGAREQTFIQRYYLYLNLTKPSERLYISFSRVDSEGKALRQSYLVNVICRMFPALEVEEIGELERAADYSTRAAALDYLIYGERDEAWYTLAGSLLKSGDEEERQQIDELLQAPFMRYRGVPVSRVVAQALYGRRLEGSVTRLERFAACAYAHFLQYGLMLRERAQSGFAGVDMGNIYHAALERYSSKLEASSEDWFTVPEDMRQAMAGEAMQEVIAEYPDQSIYGSAENEHMAGRMLHIFDQTVWALTEQVRKGRFVPEQFEISFHEPDVKEALQFELGGGESLTLTGRIDRLDTCVDDDRIYVKVIDYKSGYAKFDLLKVYRGTQLQLMVYMNAAAEMTRRRSGKETVPGGVLYYHIDDPVIESDGQLTEEQAREAILMQLRPDGLINRQESIYRAMDKDFEKRSSVIPVTLKQSGDISESASHVADSREFAVVQEFVNTRMRQAGRSILDGDISVNPYQDGKEGSCTYCPYASVCGFDQKIEGFYYRKPIDMDREGIIEQMDKENAMMSESKGAFHN